MTRRIEVKCVSCGVVELTEDEYHWQLSRPGQLWSCPSCKDLAFFVGIFYPCAVVGCPGRANEIDEDVCDVCGAFQPDLCGDLGNFDDVKYRWPPGDEEPIV